MFEYARYRAVSAADLNTALADESPGNALTELATSDGPAPEIDLTNTFSALAHLLAGPGGDAEDYDDPLISAVLGHREIEPDSPTVNDPERVAEINRALDAFDRNLIVDRYDGAELDAQGVAPGGFAADPGWPETLQASFDQLRRLYADAARRQAAVLVILD
ncbi:DUF1877 family protein [Mycobacterium sp. 2YAF39]|uniref:DUF1877 family protein n=1 Tax=Mycobacterium sp. 2YAF39 TaxID=3233033 RepID=UPI003F9898AB